MRRLLSRRGGGGTVVEVIGVGVGSHEGKARPLGLLRLRVNPDGRLERLRVGIQILTVCHGCVFV